jgi:hypothetical protein
MYHTDSYHPVRGHYLELGLVRPPSGASRSVNPPVLSHPFQHSWSHILYDLPKGQTLVEDPGRLHLPSGMPPGHEQYPGRATYLRGGVGGSQCPVRGWMGVVLCPHCW